MFKSAASPFAKLASLSHRCLTRVTVPSVPIRCAVHITFVGHFHSLIETFVSLFKSHSFCHLRAWLLITSLASHSDVFCHINKFVSAVPSIHKQHSLHSPTMASLRNISTLLLLAGSSAAAPRWWSYQGPGDLKKHAQASTSSVVAEAVPASAATTPIEKVAVQAAYTPPPGGFVSNGILYLTTTIYLQPGESPPTAVAPAPIPAASSPVQAAPVAPVSSQQAPAPEVAPPQPVATVATSSQAAAPQVASPQPAANSPSKSPAPDSLQIIPVTSTNKLSATAAQQAAASPASNSGSGGSITSDIIAAIAPNSQSCDNAPAAGECATAAQAAPAFNSAFAKYGINTPGAQAAVIAWEAFESAQFKYKVNKVPGNPGQGTRCMMMPNFVSEYASAAVGAAQVSSAGSPAAILALVNGDDAGSFGGGAWYMSTKCPNLISQFSTSADSAWSTFMTSCVSTTDTADRDALWTAAKKALGV
jgi:hypothetical protein